MSPPAGESRRILVVDDNPSIHQDFRKILARPEDDVEALDAMESMLFGALPPRSSSTRFELDFALGGEEGLRRVREAVVEGRPYALAFVDIRMPPGIDGVETTLRMWREEADLQVVLCSAHSDYSWDELARKLGTSERLLILRKPFDNIEVRQMAHALCEKWELLRASHQRLEDLERMVEERTRALAEANARLMHAQKLEALGRMSAGLAHEVNNPLSFILSNLRHVVKGLEVLPCPEGSVGARDDLREACKDAILGAERIARIVQDVRIFARVDEPPRDPVDVREVAELSISMASEALRSGVRLVRDFHAVPPVLGSEHGLGQVFTNLIVNAAHALRGREDPFIRLGILQRDDGRIVVEVQDNGSGIPAEHLSRLFEPFFTTKPVGTGTGLGLSICHGIVTRLGGDITVDSAPGQGTTFRVVLPAAPAEVVASASLEHKRLA
ncbi:sensor histidine kinase [Vitiosangium sp. GDMCC 1.1324]|uniref:sensor histidine kinase n=1 Tax=Vitiosangium sp. (strain GDMCC 1.1324) TaxID=2138576 RepID=UPI000D3A67F1|nr:ATP-binding protein [Vitiosangium sp. GDMCC 1.1324]PTL81959.1 hybrid sensor histidine kinase/response regulator [Vitiosangium sp. GDMCC 1.1324]